MKQVLPNRLLLFLLFFIACGYSYTACACGLVSHGGWRWRNNDGSETSATWKTDQNVSIVQSGPGGILRLRIEVTNSRRYQDFLGNCTTPIDVLLRDTLQYTTTPADAASWITIDNSATKAFMLAGSASTNVLQGEPTTPQITGTASGSYTFSPGRIMASTVAINETLPASSRTEYEWVIKGTGRMIMGTTYYFRQRATFIPLAGATYPSVTTVAAAPLPVKLTNFSVKKEGGKVRIEWTTVTEQNSDHFEILRSADGQNWKAIAQVQSRGNTTAATNYFAYDDFPLSALNYYRLKQIDRDGQSSLSEVKSLRLFTDAIVSVWPNPASSYINFSLQEAEANVVATLQDAAGRTVHQQTFANLQAGAVNKLVTVQRPPAGIYVLKLEADGFSETRKIIIQ